MPIYSESEEQISRQHCWPLSPRLALGAFLLNAQGRLHCVYMGYGSAVSGFASGHERDSCALAIVLRCQYACFKEA